MPANDLGKGPIGLIAGNGAFPKLFARAAAQAGHRVVAIAHRGETAPDLQQAVDALTWVRVGQLGAIFKTFERAGVRHAAMAGGIDKRRLLGHFRPDFAGLRLLWRLARRRDDAMLKAVASTFEARGIHIISSTVFLPEVLAPVGVLGQVVPSQRVQRDLAEGLRLAVAIGALDVGQTVALKEGTVVALEALEGTDGCIERAGALTGGRGVVIVKAAKPNQDMRFDVPTIGPKTVAVAAAAGVAAIGLEAGRTLILEADETIQAANRAGVALVGLEGAR